MLRSELKVFSLNDLHYFIKLNLKWNRNTADYIKMVHLVADNFQMYFQFSAHY